MKKLLLALTSILASSSVIAGWVAVDTNYDAGLTAYADPVTIRKSGNIVKMWILHDHSMVQTNAREPYMSIKARWKYNCKEKQIQFLYEVLYSENMAEGKIVRSLGLHNKKWQPVSPGGTEEILWKFACGKLMGE